VRSLEDGDWEESSRLGLESLGEKRSHHVWGGFLG